jgi:hypothetical protein
VSNLPVLHSGSDLPARHVGRAVRAQRDSEMTVYKYGLRAREHAEMSRLDTQALSDVVKCALEEELNLMAWGMSETEGSLARAEVVARKLALFTDINTERIQRRFGR